MRRDHASDGEDRFELLRGRLGRLPTVDELSREFDPARRSRRRRLPLISLLGLALMAVALFMSSELPLPDWLLPDAQTPAPPAAPPIEAEKALPALPTLPPEEAPPPAAVAEQPAPKPKPAPAPAVAPAPAPEPPRSNATVQHEVLPQISATARRTITGTIRINIRVAVDENGNVTNAESLSPDVSRYFNGLTLKAAQDWKFASGDGPRQFVLRFGLTRGDTTVTTAQD